MSTSRSTLPPSSSPSSSRPHLAPLTLTRASTTLDSDRFSCIEVCHPSSYQARMAGGKTCTSSPTSYSYPSLPSSPVSRRGSASSTRSASIAAEPVVRGGFIIPSITLTPPIARHSRSQPLPWQDFTSKTTLYVPVKTEDIGWEDGGLWWCGKFEYREVNLYGGEDDHVVGKYRAGPEGYSYMDVWDKEAFEATASGPPRQNHEPAPQKASSGKKKTTTSEKRCGIESEDRVATSISSTSTSSSSTSSSSVVSPEPKGESIPPPLAATVVSLLPEVPSTTPTMSRRSSASSCPSLSSTPSSSRRSSDSTKDDDDNLMDLNTPTDSPRGMSLSGMVVDSLGKGEGAESLFIDSPVSTLDGTGGKAPFARLEAALSALKAEKKTKDDGRAAGTKAAADDDDNEEVEDTAAQTLSDTARGAKSSSSSSIASLAAHTSTSPLKLGKSLLLSEDGPSASHHWPKGRSLAKLAGRGSAATRIT